MRGQVRFTHTKIAQITINYLGTAKSSQSLSHSHKPLVDLEWRLEECLSVGEKNWCEIWYLAVNVELFSRAWNLMSPLVISSTRNEMTSTTQRLQTELNWHVFCNKQHHRDRNNENFRAIILTGIPLWLIISFYHYRAPQCTLHVLQHYKTLI